MHLVKPPLLLKWLYPTLTWNKSRTEKIVYLTFDDGPIPNVTEFVLNTLKSFQIKATFFCIGDNIRKHPLIFERIKNENHSIGNHTFNHLNGWKTDTGTYVQNFLKCQEISGASLFRPPYGRITHSQIRHLNALAHQTLTTPHNTQHITPNAQHETRNTQSATYSPQPATNQPPLQIVMWDVLSRDFDLKCSPEKCYQHVIKYTQNGSIIVFHDSLKAFSRMQYALPRAIEYLLQAGYRFGKL